MNQWLGYHNLNFNVSNGSLCIKLYGKFQNLMGHYTHIWKLLGSCKGKIIMCTCKINKAIIKKFLDYHPHPSRFFRPPRFFLFLFRKKCMLHVTHCTTKQNGVYSKYALNSDRKLLKTGMSVLSGTRTYTLLELGLGKLTTRHYRIAYPIF